MTKQELKESGWEIMFWGNCNVESWGKFAISAKHTSGRMVAGYGDDEAAALTDIEKTLSMPLGPIHEVGH